MRRGLGQRQGEGGALADRALHPDVAARLLEETVDDAQAKSAAVVSLGREERLEDAFLHMGRHAAAGVADADFYRPALRSVGCRARRGRAQCAVQGEHAAPRHCSAPVQRQIENRVLELPAVDQHTGPAGLQIEFDADVLAQRVGDQVLQTGEHLVDIEHFGAQRLPASEGQQARREHCAALRSSECTVDDAAHVGRQVVARLQQLQVAEDRREQVVEIVRDATRELAQHLHLLGLPHLPFECAAFALVAVQRDETAGRHRMVAHGQHLAVVEQMVFALPRCIGRTQQFDGRTAAGQRRQRVAQCVERRAGMHRLRRKMQQGGEPRVPGDEPAFGVERAQTVVDAVEHRAQQASLFRDVRAHSSHR
ncbi:hypothetical protein D9M68_587160 [compost metagenome]